jgi:hypothetical protein
MARMIKLRGIDTSQVVGGEADLVVQMTPYIATCIIAQIDDTEDQSKILATTIVHTSMDQELTMRQKTSKNAERHSLTKLSEDCYGSGSNFVDAKPETPVDSWGARTTGRVTIKDTSLTTGL